MAKGKVAFQVEDSELKNILRSFLRIPSPNLLQGSYKMLAVIGKSDGL